MAWLWASWDEFESAVRPVALKRASFRFNRTETLFQSNKRLSKAIREFTDAVFELGNLGFGPNWIPSFEAGPVIAEARNVLINAVFAGEELLLLHKRLAKTEDAYGFLRQRELFEDWDHYTGLQFGKELTTFIADSNKLLEGYYRLASADEQFLLHNLELPEHLEADFRTARDLFSVGFDDVGLLIAGRGLEGVLRQVARNRRLHFDDRRKTVPAAEADFADLIEIISQVRWKVSGLPLITRQTKALLHLLRTIRNSQAHPGSNNSTAENSREMAGLIASIANETWKTVTSSRAHLIPATVQKNW